MKPYTVTVVHNTRGLGWGLLAALAINTFSAGFVSALLKMWQPLLVGGVGDAALALALVFALLATLKLVAEDC